MFSCRIMDWQHKTITAVTNEMQTIPARAVWRVLGTPFSHWPTLLKSYGRWHTHNQQSMWLIRYNLAETRTRLCVEKTANVHVSPVYSKNIFTINNAAKQVNYFSNFSIFWKFRVTCWDKLVSNAAFLSGLWDWLLGREYGIQEKTQ